MAVGSAVAPARTCRQRPQSATPFHKSASSCATLYDERHGIVSRGEVTVSRLDHHDRSDGTAGRLRRSVGFYGLMFVSLGSIIGSGWLLGALTAAQAAGPASVLSWVLAAGMLSLLALTYAELGA